MAQRFRRLSHSLYECKYHVVFCPKYRYRIFKGYLKGKMALRLFQQYESLGRRYWGRHLWARGYCVSTIGLDEEKIRKYVQWQEKQEKQAEIVQGKLFD
ncbi:MAG: transposase [Anaerolineales bacterium]